jgi:cobalt-zinc-cadmium efflux system outer membrane protein
LFDAGNLGELERVQAEASAAERHAARLAAELDATRAREAVDALFGLRDDVAWTAVELPVIPDAELAGTATVEAAEHRLDLEAARLGVETLARAVENKRRTRWLPVGVEVGVERERETDRVTVTGPTVALRLPLFDTGKASLARLESEWRAARWQLESRTVAARSEARAAQAAVEAARAREALLRQEVAPRRARALDLTLRGYNMMLAGAPQVLLAKQAELDAERDAVGARLDYWLARTALARALGSSATASTTTKETPK